MKIGKNVGIIFSLMGIIIGLYLGVSPILQSLLNGEISGQQAGVYLATIGAILGLSSATACIVFNRAVNT
jgi:hypothetical protein